VLLEPSGNESPAKIRGNPIDGPQLKV